MEARQQSGGRLTVRVRAEAPPEQATHARRQTHTHAADEEAAREGRIHGSGGWCC